VVCDHLRAKREVVHQLPLLAAVVLSSVVCVGWGVGKKIKKEGKENFYSVGKRASSFASFGLCVSFLRQAVTAP